MKEIDIKRHAETIIKAIKEKHCVFVCGNGGSAAQSQHFCAELVGKYKYNRRALPAISLFDLASLTAIANDFSFSEVFSRQLEALGKEGDILITLSTSGKSKNILEAIKVAKKARMKTISFPTNQELGFDTPRTQEIHLEMIHKICELVEKEFI